MPAGKIRAIAGSAWTRRLDAHLHPDVADDVVLDAANALRSLEPCLVPCRPSADGPDGNVIREVDVDVILRSLDPYRSARRAGAQPDVATIEGWRDRLRTAFGRYRLDCERMHFTATEARTRLSAIIRAAQNVAASPSWKSLDALLSAVEDDPSIETVLRRHLEIPGDVWLAFKTDVLRKLSADEPADPDLRARVAVAITANVVRIADLDVRNIVRKSGRWQDPAIVPLVSVLAQVWEEVTGRTAAQSTDRIDQTKRFPFAAWLEKFFRQIGVEAPKRGQILRIVLHQKRSLQKF